jgi:methionyl-tRNA formyltransferase
MSKKYILLSEKQWHKPLFQSLKERVNAEWKLIDNKEEFTPETLTAFNPDRIFIPHWSYIIPKQIYEKYNCVVFHMTDLPYGRGGSPLQNLIERGHTETKISAIRVEKVVDAGPIYLKRSLSLEGTAQEIFLRSVDIIFEMIVHMHSHLEKPVPQSGDPVVFKRRTPEQSNLTDIKDVQKLYDHIRMLDCDGYPQAFLETEHFRFEFSKAAIIDQQTLSADVRITKK